MRLNVGRRQLNRPAHCRFGGNGLGLCHFRDIADLAHAAGLRDARPERDAKHDAAERGGGGETRAQAPSALRVVHGWHSGHGLQLGGELGDLGPPGVQLEHFVECRPGFHVVILVDRLTRGDELALYPSRPRARLEPCEALRRNERAGSTGRLLLETCGSASGGRIRTDSPANARIFSLSVRAATNPGSRVSAASIAANARSRSPAAAWDTARRSSIWSTCHRCRGSTAG